MPLVVHLSAVPETSQWRKNMRQRLNILIFAAIAAIAALLISQHAFATELGNNALKDLTLDRTWSGSRLLTGYQASFWKWKADGTVCVRLGSQNSGCTDDGTWKIVDKQICYKFTWWLKSINIMSACVSVEDRGNGDYEAMMPSGSRFLAFRVLQ
jgi:hypothetical protein